MRSNTDGKVSPNANRKRRFKWILLLLALLVVSGLTWRGCRKDTLDTGSTQGISFSAIRGPLEITVLEGGTIEARESQELKSEVQGETKILSIVEEGYLVTPEDVAQGKVLVELDSSDLEDRQTEQELEYQNAKASFTEAREQYEIQVNQNESDIKTAELDARFARMDLEKYLGAELTADIIDMLELDTAPEASTPVLTSTTEEATEKTLQEVPKKGKEEATAPSESVQASQGTSLESSYQPPEFIDFSEYADPKLLGDGEARQKLRELEDARMLAHEELALAQTTMEGTKRLFEKDFVTKNEFDTEEMTFKRKQISLDSSKTTEALFIKYEFPKQAEKLLSDYEEALRKLLRAKKTAISKLAQTEAKLNSAEAQYTLKSRRKKELAEQIEKCIIRATQPGLVVYGDGGGNRRYMREEQIEEGSSVRERQVIITIPDTSAMKVSVSVHESYVKKVHKGQQARIRVDAYPNVTLTGVVDKISVLPDSQNRWMNPDLKVYTTTILIDDTFDWMKPGMSAEVEIITESLEDAVYVPLQAIISEDNAHFCYVKKLSGVEKRLVQIGVFNDSFIEIQSGLEAGENVLLRSPSYATPPASGGTARPKGEASAPDKKSKKPKEGSSVSSTNGQPAPAHSQTMPQGERPQGKRPQGERPQGKMPQGKRPQGNGAGPKGETKPPKAVS